MYACVCVRCARMHSFTAVDETFFLSKSCSVAAECWTMGATVNSERRNTGLSWFDPAF